MWVCFLKASPLCTSGFSTLSLKFGLCLHKVFQYKIVFFGNVVGEKTHFIFPNNSTLNLKFDKKGKLENMAAFSTIVNFSELYESSPTEDTGDMLYEVVCSLLVLQAQMDVECDNVDVGQLGLLPDVCYRLANQAVSICSTGQSNTHIVQYNLTIDWQTKLSLSVLLVSQLHRLYSRTYLLTGKPSCLYLFSCSVNYTDCIVELTYRLWLWLTLCTYM